MNTLLSDIIKYQNIEDVVMARHPVEKVYSNTRVQVMEGHEAVIEIEKSLSGPYGEGEHVIFDDAEGFYTDILYRIQKQHPYSCKVYYVNRAELYTFDFGAGNLIFNPKRPDLGTFRFGMSGRISIEINDSVRFVNVFKRSRYVTTLMLDEAVTDVVSEVIKENISDIIRNNHMDILRIEDYLSQLEKCMENTIKEALESIGLDMKAIRIDRVEKNGTWNQDDKDQLSTEILTKFHELRPSEKKSFFKRFCQLVTTPEEMDLLDEVRMNMGRS